MQKVCSWCEEQTCDACSVGNLRYNNGSYLLLLQDRVPYTVSGAIAFKRDSERVNSTFPIFRDRGNRGGDTRSPSARAANKIIVHT